MKRIFYVLLAGSLLFACKKGGGGNTPLAAKTIDSVKITSRQYTMPVPPKNPGNYNIWFTLFNNRLYWINPSNTPIPQFMYAYNIASNTLTGIPPNSEVAAAGFTSSLVNDGTNIYYIANEALLFVPSGSLTWSQMNYPASAKDNNGETGVVYSSMDSRIYFVGGRVPSRKCKSVNAGGGSWKNEPDFLYETRMPVMVVADNKIYAIGGGGYPKKFSSYAPGSGSWNALPDMNFEVAVSATNRLAAAYKDRFILLLQPADTNGGPADVYVYDTRNDQWKKDPITSTINDRNLNIFSDNDKVYIVGKNSSNDIALHELTITDLPL